MEPEQGAVKLRVLNGKGGKDRILFIAPSLYEELRKYTDKHSQEPYGIVFRTTKGKAVHEPIYAE